MLTNQDIVDKPRWCWVSGFLNPKNQGSVHKPRWCWVSLSQPNLHLERSL
ncbi:MAG: hypothetical protein F6K22_15005 [Okeania sp. SIO2F4]|nr:hypothetical protein [Okeania sp. SIO2F4]NES04028.1 hypothetical protein [Okeania sp. SIO2F4]